MRLKLTANQKDYALRQDESRYAGVHGAGHSILRMASVCQPLRRLAVLLTVVAERLSAIGIDSLRNVVLCSRIPVGLLSN